MVEFIITLFIVFIVVLFSLIFTGIWVAIEEHAKRKDRL